MSGYRLAGLIVGISVSATAAIGGMTWLLCSSFGWVGGVISCSVVALGLFFTIAWATHDEAPRVAAEPVRDREGALRVDGMSIPAALMVDCPYCGQKAGDRCRFITQRPPIPEPPAWWRTLNPHPQREHAARAQNGETR